MSYFLNFVLVVVTGSFVSSCAGVRNSPKRVVSKKEFLEVVEKRNLITDDCRSMYCHYYLKVDGDSVVYLKGEAGRLIVENLISSVSDFSESELLWLSEIDSTGVVGLSEGDDDADLRFNQMLSEVLEKEF